MGQILQFKFVARDESEPEFEHDAEPTGAVVILFPGVRYSRGERIEPTGMQGRLTRGERDWFWPVD